MSGLKQKIQEKGKMPFEIQNEIDALTAQVQMLQQADWTNLSKLVDLRERKWVPSDDILQLLDEAAKQIQEVLKNFIRNYDEEEVQDLERQLLSVLGVDGKEKTKP